MAKKLWGGRFKKKADPLIEDFTKSIDYDYKLAKYDIIGSQIHAAILEKSEFLKPEESTQLINELSKIYDQVEEGTFKFDKKSEDIHTDIQNALEKKVGDLVLKLHAARSRNDQVLFDLKIFCKFQLVTIGTLCAKAQVSLLKTCKKNIGVIIPGYTHLQHAQLIYLSDYLQSYCEMLERDTLRLKHIENNIKISLGAGALAGVPIDSQIIKDVLKENKDLKEFADAFNMDPNITIPTSIDTVSNRDFVIEILSALSILGMHLSRLSEDLIIWSTKEFGFVEIAEEFSTGSSLMPQKKNPDVLELIRGYTGTLYGNLMSVLTMMKGLPLAYNRDMQLDKPPLFSSFEIIEKELKVLPGLIETLEWKEDVIKERIEEDETLYATDWVYYLVKEKNVPFKEAHDIIGMLVKESIDTGVKIKDMKDKHVKNKISDKIDIKELIKLMDPKRSVDSRVSVDRSKLKT